MRQQDERPTRFRQGPPPISAAQGASLAHGPSRRRVGVFAALVLISCLDIAEAGPSRGHASRPTQGDCLRSPAAKAAALGNEKRAARLFLKLLSSNRCSAKAWEMAAETWLADETIRPGPVLLKRLEQAAQGAPKHLSLRILALAGRLRARRLLTELPRPWHKEAWRSASSEGGTGLAGVRDLAPKGHMRRLLQLDAPIWADPLLGRDRAGRQVLYVASIRGTIVALHPDGSLVWKRKIGEPILAGLAGAGSLLAATNLRHILVLDAGTGKVLATIPRPRKCGPPRSVHGRLEILCGHKLLAVSTKGLAIQITQPVPLTAGPVATRAKCQALGRRDGKVAVACVGRAALDILPVCNGVVVGLMGLKNGSLVASCSDGTLAATRPGGVLWKIRLPGRPTAAIGLGMQGIYVGLAGLGLVRVSKDGRILGLRPAEDSVVAGPVADRNGHVLVGGRDGRIHRWSEESGSMWSLEPRTDLDARPLVLDNASVVVATTDGRLLLVE